MGKKIGRNDPCPCGSGKKYKLCCINKMSEKEIQALYLEQFELTKGLNEANKCHKILDIGKRIIEHQQNSICATALQFYDNAYLRRLGQHGAEYGGKPWNYYGFDY